MDTTFKVLSHVQNYTIIRKVRIREFTGLCLKPSVPNDWRKAGKSHVNPLLARISAITQSLPFFLLFLSLSLTPFLFLCPNNQVYKTLNNLTLVLFCLHCFSLGSLLTRFQPHQLSFWIFNILNLFLPWGLCICSLSAGFPLITEGLTPSCHSV